jgi:hypothetical protein
MSYERWPGDETSIYKALADLALRRRAAVRAVQRLSSDRGHASEDGHHGLGLSIVRAIVDAQGGTITA